MCFMLLKFVPARNFGSLCICSGIGGCDDLFYYYKYYVIESTRKWRSDWRDKKNWNCLYVPKIVNERKLIFNPFQYSHIKSTHIITTLLISKSWSHLMCIKCSERVHDLPSNRNFYIYAASSLCRIKSSHLVYYLANCMNWSDL